MDTFSIAAVDVATNVFVIFICIIALVGLCLLIASGVVRYAWKRIFNEEDMEIEKSTSKDMKTISEGNYYLSAPGCLCLECDREIGDHARLSHDTNYVRGCKGTIIKLCNSSYNSRSK